MSFKTMVLILISSLLLWGCSNKEGALFAVTNNGSLTIEPAISSIHKGTSQAFKAFMIDADGVRSEVTHEAFWSSSNTAIATIDEDGLALALTSGQADIQATFGGLIANASLTVFEQAVQAITVSPAETLSLVGLQQQFHATAVYVDGSQQDITEFATWSSANPAIATIASDAVSTALSKGQTDIIASFNGASGTAILVVSESLAKALILQPNAPVLAMGTSQAMQALLLLEDNTQINVTAQVDWTITNPSIASIDDTVGSKGLVQGQSPGETTVNALLKFATTSLNASTSITVTDASVTELILTPSNLVVAKGASGQFQLNAHFSDGSSADVTADAVWLSEDTSIASIGYTGSTAGLVSAIEVGSTRIQASFAGAEIIADITVSDAQITFIQITPSIIDLAKGSSKFLSAKAFYSDGSSIDITAASSWVAINPAIVHVATGNVEAGLTTGVAQGQTQVSISYLGFTSKIPVHVSAAIISDIQITPQNASIANGLNLNYNASAIYSDGTVVDITFDAAWASDNVTIVSIISGGANSGLAITHTTGETKISATFAGISRLTDIEVNNASITKVSIEPINVTTAVGLNNQYSAFAEFSNGQRIDISRQAVWTSSATLIASIVPTGAQAGLATGLSPGVSTINAAFFGQSDSTQLNVSNATVVDFIITPFNREIAISTTAQYSAIATLSNNTQYDISNIVSWQVADATIAQVDGQGLAVGVGAGSSQISASLTAAGLMLEASANIKVNGAEKPLQRIDITPVDATILINSPLQYKANAVFSDGSKQDITNDVSWSSNLHDKAIIDATGLAVGISAGAVNIKASLVYFGSQFSASTILNIAAPTATIVALEVSPAATESLIGATQVYSATAILASGLRVDVTANSVWSSSNDAIAQIDGSANATALSAGTTTINADFNYAGNPYHGDTTLTVLAPSISIEKIVLEPFNSRIIVGDSLLYTAIAHLSNNNQIDITNYVSWQSSLPSIADIDVNGQALGLAEGVSDISATLLYQGQVFTSERAALSVVDATSISNIIVTPRNKQIQVAESLQFHTYAILTDLSYVEIRSTSAVDLSWSVTSTAASIDNDGLALGLAAGLTNVTATLVYNGQSYSNSTGLTVMALPATISEIQLTPQQSEILIGSSLAYRATAILSDNTKLDITLDASWSSSVIAVATIDSSGVASGLTEGASLISASINYQGVNYSGNANLTVLPATVTLLNITLEPFNSVLLEGSSQAYTAIAHLSNNSRLDITGHSGLTWASTNANTSIDVNSGIATADNPGSSTVSAVLNYQGSNYPSEPAASNVIAAASMSAIVIAPRNANILVDHSLQYSAYAVMSDFSKIDITSDVTWTTSSSPQYAFIDASGLATGVSAGESTVSARYNKNAQDFTDTTQLTVTDAAIFVSKLLVTPPNASVIIGGSQQYTAIANLSNGKSVDVTSNVAWTTNDSAISSITQLGMAIGLAQGETQVAALLVYQGSSYLTEAKLTVKPVAVVPVEMKIEPFSASIIIGGQQAYSAVAIMSDNSEVDITSAVAWSSSAEAVAKLDNKGVATGLSLGDSQISAQLIYAGNTYNSDNALLTVKNGIDNIQITPNNQSIIEGTQLQFKATAVLTDFSAVDITNDVLWGVADGSIVSIEQTGLASALKEGSTVITIDLKYEGIDYSDSESIHVTPAPITIEDLHITPATNNALVGEIVQLIATVILSNGDSQEVSSDASWSADDESIAAMQNNSGLVFALAQGHTLINASIVFEGITYTATASFTVASLPLIPHITVEPEYPKMATGSTKQMRSFVTTTDGTRYETTHISRWRVVDDSIARISATGLVTSIIAGHTNINAAIENSSRSVRLVVVDPDSGVSLVKFTPSQASLLIDDELQFTATAILNDGTEMDVSADSSWSSPSPGIADFINLDGLLTALGMGTVTTEGQYTLSSPSWLGYSDISVKDPLLTIVELQVEPDDSLLYLNTTRQYQAYARMSDGSTINITNNAAWIISNLFIVQPQSAKGLLLGRSTGSTKLKVMYNYQGTLHTVETNITVIDSAPEYLEVTPVVQTLPKDYISQYSAILHMQNGQILDVTDQVSWTVNDTDLASIDNSLGNEGRLTTLNAGDVIVNANWKGQLAQTVDLTISSASLVSVQILPSTLAIAVDSYQQLTALAEYSDESSYDVTQTAVWSSDDEAVATANALGSRGLIAGIAAGTATISAEYVEFNSQQAGTGTAVVTVSNSNLLSITIKPDNQTIANGMEQKFVALAQYQNNISLDVSHVIGWASSDSSIASIISDFTSRDHGIASAKGIGTTSIDAYFNGTKVDSAPLNVVSNQLLTILVTPLDPIVTKGAVGLFQANAIYTNGDQINISDNAIWTTSNPDIIAISKSSNTVGQATALAEGTAIISAAFDGLVGESTVVVSSSCSGNKPDSIYIVEPQTMLVGEKLQLNIIGVYEGGACEQVETGQPATVWTSNNNNIATVDNKSGVALGIAAGEATIDVKFKSDTASTTLTVVDSEQIKRLELSPNTISVEAGQTTQLTLNAIMQDDSTIDISERAYWLISQASIASISNNSGSRGLLTGNAAGTSFVTASYAGLHVQAIVTVTE